MRVGENFTSRPESTIPVLNLTKELELLIRNRLVAIRRNESRLVAETEFGGAAADSLTVTGRQGC